MSSDEYSSSFFPLPPLRSISQIRKDQNIFGIQDLGDGVLILHIHQTGAVFGDHQHRGGGNLSAHAAASVIFRVLREGSGRHAERYVHQGKDNGISHGNRVAYHGFRGDKAVHAAEQRLNSILKIIFCHDYASLFRKPCQVILTFLFR